MVAKQGWQLLSNHNALSSRLIKAKYFPNTDYFTSDLGANPSLVWRSIWEAHSILEAGSSSQKPKAGATSSTST